MRIQTAFWVFCAMVACSFAPAFAMEYDHGGHEHNAPHHEAAAQTDEHSSHANHHESATQVEEIPAGVADATGHGSHSCPHHAGQPCKCPSRMIISHCGTGGCCYKPDMPGAINLNDGNAQEVAATDDSSFMTMLSFTGFAPESNDHPFRLSFPPAPRPPHA
ncbi:MAG: hypothetical protein HZA04_04575 [Nitrospinae bacterium]|nr:hypothetical protein [Nitrospinota bacterium]